MPISVLLLIQTESKKQSNSNDILNESVQQLLLEKKIQTKVVIFNIKYISWILKLLKLNFEIFVKRILFLN